MAAGSFGLHERSVLPKPKRQKSNRRICQGVLSCVQALVPSTKIFLAHAVAGPATSASEIANVKMFPKA